MKYERITERRETPFAMSMWADDSQSFKIYNRLAALEDKIERGELISTVQNEQSEREIEFFAEHNAAVRKEAVKGVLLTMLDRMDRLTGCGVPYHVKKFINDIAEENGVDLVKEVRGE